VASQPVRSRPQAATALVVPSTKWGLLPARYRARRYPKWWQELLFIGVSYFVYSVIRNTAPEHVTLAKQRAADLLRLEHALHIDIELSLNRAVVRHEWLAVISNYWYATAHFIVTIGTMVWLYRKHPLQYRALRTALYAATVIALVGYWLFALAPPRLMTNTVFIDTLKHFGTWGSYESGGAGELSNQYAAMPSMHIGWAVWCGLSIVMCARRRWVRWLGAAYPIITTYVIMATGNHFVLDAAGGVVTLMAGFGVQRLLGGGAAVDRDLLSHLTAPDAPAPPPLPDPGEERPAAADPHPA
jgi:hypothetical protein